ATTRSVRGARDVFATVRRSSPKAIRTAPSAYHSPDVAKRSPIQTRADGATIPTAPAAVMQRPIAKARLFTPRLFRALPERLVADRSTDSGVRSTGIRPPGGVALGEATLAFGLRRVGPRHAASDGTRPIHEATRCLAAANVIATCKCATCDGQRTDGQT